MNKKKLNQLQKKAISYFNGNYYSNFEEKLIIGSLEGALEELEEKE